MTLCTKWPLILGHFISYKTTGRLKFGINLKIGTIPLQNMEKKTNKQNKTKNDMMKANVRDTEPWRDACFKNAHLQISNSKCFQKLAKQAFPKSLNNPTKKGNEKYENEKYFSTQWLNFSPKSKFTKRRHSLIFLKPWPRRRLLLPVYLVVLINSWFTPPI